MHNTTYFPATRYFGSKRKLIDWISPLFKKYSPESAVDVFAGTGSMTILLSKIAKRVAYHDSFNWNFEVGKALFDSTLLPTSAIANLLANVKPYNGFISKNFENIFFTTEENNWLDGFALMFLDTPINYPIKYSVYQACLKKRPFNLFHRANLKLRLADVPRTFGNKSTWDRSFSSHAIEAYSELEAVREKLDTTKIEVLRPTSPLKLPSDYNLVYLDPPYLSDSRNESYVKRYHFLEGLSRYESWPSLINQFSPIKCLPNSYFDEQWEHKEKMPGLLAEMLLKHRRSDIVISYLKDGYPSIPTIIKMLKSTHKKICIYEHEKQFSISNKSSTQVLIMARAK